MINLPLISPLTFRHPDLPGGSYRLPNEPTLTVSLAKTVSITPVAGRDFGVIELAAAKNYRINIEGVTDPLDPDEDRLPEEAIRALNNLARINASLEVESEVLSYFGIRNLVIENFSVNLVEYANQVGYRFDTISDDPFELQLLRESAIQ